MALLRQWRYGLALLVVLAVIVDIRHSSFVLNRSAFHFHHGWLYLLAIFVPILAAVYYFNSYDDKEDYSVRHWLGIVASVLFLAFISSYFLFHMALWLASYTPILPAVSRELTILERQPFSGRSAARIVIAEDTDNNQIKLRLFGLYWREGDVVEVDCVQIGSVCRITDTAIRQ